MADLVGPTRPQNAYWLWLRENRNALAEEAGTGKGSVVGKLAGEKWKAMKDAQKAPFEKQAAELKATYEKAAANSEKKARKNSCAPKRSANAYWIWLGDNRNALEKEAGSRKGPWHGVPASQLAAVAWQMAAGSRGVAHGSRGSHGVACQMAAGSRGVADGSWQPWPRH